MTTSSHDFAMDPLSISVRGRVSVGNIAYTSLREAIVNGRLAPGQQLAEVPLSKELQVSRTPLRQAIERLESEGLVVRAMNGRLNVAPVSEEDVKHLFTVRMALEDLALSEALPLTTDNDIETLGRHIKAMEMLGEIKSNVAEAGIDFHDLIYRISGNTILLQLLAQIQARIDRYRFIGTMGSDRRQAEAIEEHREIYNLVAKRDLPRARTALQQHLAHARRAALRRVSNLTELTEESK
jgi:DNA-binding GntR family transcriptional regulator